MSRNTGNAANATMDSSQNPSSHYFLHTSESLAAVLVSPLLAVNGSNYHSWARNVKRALIAKNKFRFLDGSITVPDQFDPSAEAWKRCNNMVLSWICNSLSPSMKQSVIFMEYAYDVWKDLKLRFSQGDFVRIAKLQQELYTCRQDAKLVSDFFTEFEDSLGRIRELQTD